LRDRFFLYGEYFFRRPDETINKAVVNFADKKATYRLFSHKISRQIKYYLSIVSLLLRDFKMNL
ncbi:MAG: hypothetical protein HOP07_14960, partial [Bacteriovoracaceae bacterium]|nr:hypothetical protein [Bacteriovoracaceae bacterium]